MLYSDGTMRNINKVEFDKRLESHCPEVLTELPGIPASTSHAYIIDDMDMLQSVNENHLTTFSDLAVISDSETSSSTSWKRILGIGQCGHCLRPM